MKLILHSYRRCPFCIRTRILLCLKKIPYEIVEEPLREWTPWMLEWSKKNDERPRVPVLRDINDDGTEETMPESNEMNLFIDAMSVTPEFTPELNTDSYKEMITWFDWCARELKPMIDLYKYGVNLKFDAETHVVHTAELQKRIQELEDELGSKKFLIENRLTLADIAIIPFIRQIMRTREGEFDFAPYSKVLLWTNSIVETDWFKEIVMKK